MPRLILADWLDEHSRPERAEFIRVQVELARAAECGRCDGAGNRRVGRVTDECPFCRQYQALRRRERELWPRAGTTIGGLMGGNGVHWRYRRGFVTEFVCSWADWLPHADAVLAECPIRHAKDGLVELTGEPPVDRWPPEAFLAAAWPGVRFELPGYPAAT